MLKEEREQWSKLKDKPFKEKFSYFWYYYKYHVIGTIIGIICITIFVLGYIESSKEPSIYLALINSGYLSVSETSLMDDYVKSRNIDTDIHPAKFDISMTMTQGVADDASVANSQKLMALLQTHALDVIVCDTWIIDEYASLSAYGNLELLLPKDLFEKVQDKLYYATKDGQKIPVAIYADKFPKLMEAHGYSQEHPPAIAISGTTDRLDTAVDFIRYLLEK